MSEFRVAANWIGFPFTGWGHLQLVLVKGSSQLEIECSGTGGHSLHDQRRQYLYRAQL